MASGWTDSGFGEILSWAMRNAEVDGTAIPTNLYLVLITNAATPTKDTTVFSGLTEIAAGNGYTSGGYQLTRNTTDFDVAVKDTGNDRGYVQMKNIVWNASGGPIPSSGTGAYHAVLTDDNGTLASRLVYAYFDLSGPITASNGQSITLTNTEMGIQVYVA